MNELIALDVMNYHDENRSQTHSLAAPAYSTKDTRKYLKFSLDIKICLFVCEFGHSKMRQVFYEVTLQFFCNRLEFKCFQVLFVEEAGAAKECVYELFYHDNSTRQGR